MHKGPLDPRANPATLSATLTSRKWEKSPVLQRISCDNVLEVFPDDKALDAAGSMLVLIAGANQTGKESLRNPILHKLERDGAAAGVPPIVTELELRQRRRSGRQHPADRHHVRLTLHEGAGLALPARADLEQILEKATNRRSASDNGLLRGRLPAVAPVDPAQVQAAARALGERRLPQHASGHLQLDASSLQGDRDPHGRPDQRRRAAGSRWLDEKRSVVLIESSKLGHADVERARAPPSQRGAPSRLGFDAASLFPLSADALDALYDKGPTFAAGDEIRWHLDFVNSTLRRAIDDHVSAPRRRSPPAGRPCSSTCRQRSASSVPSPSSRHASPFTRPSARAGEHDAGRVRQSISSKPSPHTAHQLRTCELGYMREPKANLDDYLASYFRESTSTGHHRSCAARTAPARRICLAGFARQARDAAAEQPHGRLRMVDRASFFDLFSQIIGQLSQEKLRDLIDAALQQQAARRGAESDHHDGSSRAARSRLVRSPTSPPRATTSIATICSVS